MKDPRSTLSLLLLLTLSLALHGCLAQGHCLSQEDCPSGQICVQGECRHQCKSDGDCDPPFVCKDHLCKLPAGCVGCAFDHAAAVCDEASCEMGACDEGWHDINGVADDGCEYECTPTGKKEACNEADDDCDGLTDEDFNFKSDVSHCGDCATVCEAGPNATPVCAGGDCTYSCMDGWFDNNGDAEDGCEAEECVPICDPVDLEPACDGKDDDCDGTVDDGWDKTAAASCGPFCVDCTALYDHAEGLCADAACDMGPCQGEWEDVNQDANDGCECLFTGPEICDGMDNDCNGAIDDGLNCCPDDMVQVDPTTDCVAEVTKPFCIDRWEATVWDSPTCDGTVFANPQYLGCNLPDLYPAGFPVDVCSELPCQAEETPLYACSLPGVYPSRCISWYQARRACQNVGKRLCTPEEWQLSCHGAACTTYPYGDDFTWDVCNYIGTHDDGWYVLPTGAMAGCVNDWGVTDISGNVWEYDSSGGGHVRGGAYNCNDAGAPVLESCENVTTFSPLFDDTGAPVGALNNVGFRCCK